MMPHNNSVKLHECVLDLSDCYHYLSEVADFHTGEGVMMKRERVRKMKLRIEQDLKSRMSGFK